MPTCKKCGAPIVLVRTPDNQLLPCDPDLVEYHAGNTPDFEDYVISEKGTVIQCTFDFQCDPDGYARFPHWKSCPYEENTRRQESLWQG